MPFNSRPKPPGRLFLAFIFCFRAQEMHRTLHRVREVVTVHRLPDGLAEKGRLWQSVEGRIQEV